MADNDAILQSTKASIDALFSGVSRSAGNATSSLYGLSSSARNVQKSFDNLGSSISGASSASSNQATASQYAASAMGGAAAATQEFSGVLHTQTGIMVMGINQSMEELRESMDKGSGAGMNMLKGLLKRLGPVGKMLSFAGSAAVTAGKYIIETGQEAYSGWQESAKMGASFGSSMVEYTKAVGASKLGFEEFNSIMRKNADALSVFGGTLGGGAEMFSRAMAVMGDFNKGIMQNVREGRSFIETTRMLGLSTKDTAELMADMNSQTVMAGNLRKLDAQGQAVATAEYISQMHELSVITGKSIKEQSEQRKKLAADAQFQAAIYKMPLKQQEAMMKAYEEAVATGGPQAGELFKAGVTGSFKNVSAEARQMAATQMGTAYIEMGQATRDAGENAAQVFQEFLPRLKSAMEATRDQFAAGAAAGVPMFLNMFEQSFKQTVRLDGIQEAADKISGGGLNIAQALEVVYKDIHNMRTKRTADGQVVTEIGDETTTAIANIEATKEEIMFAPINAAIPLLEDTFNDIGGTINGLSKSLGIGFGAEMMDPVQANLDAATGSISRLSGSARIATDAVGFLKDIFGDLMDNIGLSGGYFDEIDEHRKESLLGEQNVVGPREGSEKLRDFDPRQRSLEIEKQRQGLAMGERPGFEADKFQPKDPNNKTGVDALSELKQSNEFLKEIASNTAKPKDTTTTVVMKQPETPHPPGAYAKEAMSP